MNFVKGLKRVMSSLVDARGMPLQKNVKRREMKSGQIKKTRHGDILFKLVVDLPKDVPEDEYLRAMVEYFSIGAEAFKAKLR